MLLRVVGRVRQRRFVGLPNVYKLSCGARLAKRAVRAAHLFSSNSKMCAARIEGGRSPPSTSVSFNGLFGRAHASVGQSVPESTGPSLPSIWMSMQMCDRDDADLVVLDLEEHAVWKAMRDCSADHSFRVNHDEGLGTISDRLERGVDAQDEAVRYVGPSVLFEVLKRFAQLVLRECGKPNGLHRRLSNSSRTSCQSRSGR